MTWWHYLLLANVYLTLFFVFYALFLRKETFFNLNRVYLVSSAILSFLIPMIESDWIKNLFITTKVKETIYQVGPVVMARITAHTTPDHQLTLGQVLAGVYIAGILVLSLRFIYQLAVINWAISQPKSDTSFSFFNQIRIEERDTDNTVITAHEEVHARQWHSADVLLLEAIMIVNWFNPVVYLYRNAVKYIHEFIADRDAIKAGTDKSEYAMLLLSQTFVTPPYHLVNPFFTSSLLKQRIQMMHKNRSHWMMLIKYGLSAPLFALMLILTSATVDRSKTIKAITYAANHVFNTPASDGLSGLSKTDQEDLNTVIKEHMAAGRNAATSVDGVLPNEDNADIVTNVQRNASFPGGQQAFLDYLWFNMEYPAQARQKNIQGKVFCTFVVEKDGSITGIKVLRGIGGGADEEAVRVLQSMPKWNAGIQNGALVRQQYTVPISFALTEKADDGPKESFTFSKKITAPQPKDTSSRLTNIRPMRDTTSLEGRYISASKTLASNDDYGFANTSTIAPKKLDVIKDKLIKNLYSEKLTNGVVLMVTKHKPFFATGDLNY